MNNHSIELAKTIYQIINNKKVEDIEVLDVHELTTLTDIFVIAIGNNTRQTKALADEVEFVLRQEGIEAYQKEGYDTASWILMDYQNVIVHILYKEDAEFYALDRLWQDSKIIIF